MSRLNRKAAKEFADGMWRFILYDDCDTKNPSTYDYRIAEIKQEREQENIAWRKKETRKWKALIKNRKERKPDTTIRGGDPKCRHRFKVSGTNQLILSLSCEKCKAHKERYTTPRERRIIIKQNKRMMQRIDGIHKLSHAFQRKFTANTGRFEIKGWKLIQSLERFAKKYPSIKQVGVDDDHHAGSDMFLIPHETRNEYWGTSVIYVPQCTGEPATRFFLYPGHLNHLVETLQEIQKRTTRKNKDNGRKGEDY